PDEKELGVLVIDIGGGTTDLALLRDGAVWHTAILPLGGDHISNDVAVGLRTPLTAAEALKKHYGCALTALVPAEETVDVPSVGGRKPRQLSRQVLSEIIQPRVEEIFSLVAREMTRAGFEDAATAGVVVTGGSSIMQGVPELAESVFDQPVRRGVPGDVSGLVNVVKSPVYATAVGLALYGARRQGPLGTWTDTTGGTFARLGRRQRGEPHDGRAVHRRRVHRGQHRHAGAAQLAGARQGAARQQADAGARRRLQSRRRPQRRPRGPRGDHAAAGGRRHGLHHRRA